VSYRAPNEHEAGERAWAVVRSAYESREPVAWPRRHARPLVAGALVAAVVAAALSPPGRSVVRSLRKAVGVERARPALFSLPAPGQLLVTSRSGAWLVRADGSKRLLGPYLDAAFSPHGLFIAATRANELVALDPKGKVSWTVARPSPRFPIWTGTRTDTRIAYISRGRVRVVAGDGTGDRALAPAALVPPSWRPGADRVLAYAPTPRTVAVVSLDSGTTVLRLSSTEPIRKLEWSDNGRLLLVFTPHVTRVYDLRGRVVTQDDPSDETRDIDGAFQPGTERVAVVRIPPSGISGSSDVFFLRTGRKLVNVTGAVSQLAWSPNGRWALVTWPTANQWIFVRDGRRKIVGVSRISNQFGGQPRVEDWCCAP
jgi:WD40 repeat protein